MNDAAKGALQGVIASMAMTGMRVVTTELGLIKQPPPQQIAGKTHGVKRALVELAHWGFGAAGASVYGALPDDLRKQPWTGPMFGMVMWGGFEVTAPLLGLPHAQSPRILERLATMADHALYGYVLSETRRVPTY